MQDPQGEGCAPGLGAAIGILSHAVLVVVLVAFGALAATLAAILLVCVVVRAPGHPQRRP